MKKTIAILSLFTLLLPAAARAGADSGLTLSLRAGYGLPLGSAGEGTDRKDLAKGAAPVQLDLGWRFSPRWQAGAYFSWGPTLVAGAAKRALESQGAFDVSGHFEQRLGLQGAYTFAPIRARVSPWLGASAGYEWTRYADAKLTTANGTVETEVGMRGFEASLQGGADYRLSPRFSVGPFAAIHVGQYRTGMRWVEREGETTRRVADKGVHEWLSLGVKGTFDL